MNSNLNLASRPFNNRTLPWALTAMVLLVSVIGLILVVRLTTVAKKQADAAQIEINGLRQQEKSLMETAQAVKESLTADQQQAVPSAHALINRKGFSWSRLLADLEASLPGNVKVSRIAVRDVTTQADQTIALLDLAVFTNSPATISEMISAMHREGIFYKVELRQQNLQKGRGESGTEYELDVLYRSRPGYSTENVAEVAEPQTSSEVPR